MPRPNKKKRKPKSKLTAETADRHVLYGLSVQNVEAEIDFVDETFKALRGRHAESLREDFCGTANSAAEWVQRRETNRAVGVDLDSETLDWAREHTLPKLTEAQRSRVVLLERDVRDPGPEGNGHDVVLAMNFSYWLLNKRNDLVAYFRTVRESLGPDGVFILDHYGGSDALTETTEDRELDGFTYVWDQDKYDPISGMMTAYIHFKFPDGTKLKKAFKYHWRHYTLPELQDCLLDAGFSDVTVYWEGEDEDGEGDGVFSPATEGEADPAFITYVVAQR
ncbi:MAG: class I SAM-dependent methyltransferase [Phycisphaerales bacterium JB054]